MTKKKADDKNKNTEKKPKVEKEYHEGKEIIAKEIQVINGVKYKKLILIDGTSTVL